MGIKPSNAFGILSVLLLVAGGDLFQQSVKPGGREPQGEIACEESVAFDRDAKFSLSIAFLILSAISYLLRIGFGLAEKKKRA